MNKRISGLVVALVLDRWIAPLFAGETAEDARLRHAACLLADTSWRANPATIGQPLFSARLRRGFAACSMANKFLLLASLGVAAGFLLWVSRPAQQGTHINAVAGLRG